MHGEAQSNYNAPSGNADTPSHPQWYRGRQVARKIGDGTGSQDCICPVVSWTSNLLKDASGTSGREHGEQNRLCFIGRPVGRLRPFIDKGVLGGVGEVGVRFVLYQRNRGYEGEDERWTEGWSSSEPRIAAIARNRKMKYYSDILAIRTVRFFRMQHHHGLDRTPNDAVPGPGYPPSSLRPSRSPKRRVWT